MLLLKKAQRISSRTLSKKKIEATAHERGISSASPKNTSYARARKANNLYSDTRRKIHRRRETTTFCHDRRHRWQDRQAHQRSSSSKTVQIRLPGPRRARLCQKNSSKVRSPTSTKESKSAKSTRPTSWPHAPKLKIEPAYSQVACPPSSAMSSIARRWRCPPPITSLESAHRDYFKKYIKLAINVDRVQP